MIPLTKGRYGGRTDKHRFTLGRTKAQSYPPTSSISDIAKSWPSIFGSCPTFASVTYSCSTHITGTSVLLEQTAILGCVCETCKRTSRVRETGLPCSWSPSSPRGTLKTTSTTTIITARNDTTAPAGRSDGPAVHICNGTTPSVRRQRLPHLCCTMSHPRASRTGL